MIASKAWADTKKEINFRIDELISEQKTYLAKLDREVADWKKKKASGDKSAEKKFAEVSEAIKSQKKTYEFLKKTERPNAAMEVATLTRDGIMKDLVKLIREGKIDKKRVNEIIKEMNDNNDVMGRSLGEVNKILSGLMRKQPKDLDGKVLHAYEQATGCKDDIRNFMDDIAAETKKAMDLVKQILSNAA